MQTNKCPEARAGEPSPPPALGGGGGGQEVERGTAGEGGQGRLSQGCRSLWGGMQPPVRPAGRELGQKIRLHPLASLSYLSLAKLSWKPEAQGAHWLLRAGPGQGGWERG